MDPAPADPVPAIRDGWFRETCSLWPGQAMALQVDRLLHHRRSRYQEILVFRSKTYGNVLVLDGVIQCTERDEFSYQEMIANLPLCSHPSPRKVLIIGGGDGGVLREVVKHPTVESVVQCEIDEDVIEVSKKYLPGMAVGYSSPKLTLHVRDGFEFMQQNQDAFDVIITDSSDPMGPAESLFKESYYQLMKMALREGGILCCQGKYWPGNGGAAPSPPSRRPAAPIPSRRPTARGRDKGGRVPGPRVTGRSWPGPQLAPPPVTQSPLLLSTQASASGSIWTSSRRCASSANPCSPWWSTPTAPSPPTPAARSASCCAARTR
uniref:Spermidine synthase n=1 Tax=Ornithorhynchus anatinus TaxID=9258 RepID=A0A6I8NFF4_ORNAN